MRPPPINPLPMKNALQPRANGNTFHLNDDWLGVPQGDLLPPLLFNELDKRRLFNNIIFEQVFLNRRGFANEDTLELM